MQLRDLRLGMRVVVQKNKIGTVRFLGRTKFARDDWVGVELDAVGGKHDGIVEGVRYFQCARPNTGVFVRANDVELEPGALAQAMNQSSSRPSSSPNSPVHGKSMAAAMEAAAAANASAAAAAVASGDDESSSGAVSSRDEAHRHEEDGEHTDEQDDQPGPELNPSDGSARSKTNRGGHFRSSSDLARIELAQLLAQPNSSFLKNKSGILRELTTRIARRPSTTELLKSGILYEPRRTKRGAKMPTKGSLIPPQTPATPTAGWGQAAPSVVGPASRRLWVFGENAHGELSTGDEIDCFIPTEIKLPQPRQPKTPGITGTPSSSASASTPNTPAPHSAAASARLGSSLGTSDFAQVALGLHHMVVLTHHNEVLTCGSWIANLLGTDDRTNIHRLKRLRQFEHLRATQPDNPIISIGCGDRHTVALHQNGACESFGGTLYGKLGHTQQTPRSQHSAASSSPDASTGEGMFSSGESYSSIPGLHGQRVVQMDAGNWHTLCCTTEGAVYSFGGGGKFYNQGQLGHGDNEDRMVPRRIERFGDLPAARVVVVAICCGGYHSLALTRDRLVYAWGSGKFGQTGLGNDNNESTPQLVRGLLHRGAGAGRTIGLAAGENHSLCVQADGSVYSWGFSLQGQCGHGLSQNEKLPRRIQYFATRNIAIVQVDAGWRHSICLSSTHSVYTFGHGDRGQLGLGDTRSHSSPQLVESLEGCEIKTVAAGGSHSLAFTDFFKQAQELVFLHKVRAFSEVLKEGSTQRLGPHGEETDEDRHASASAREAARQRRLGYAASPSNSTRGKLSPRSSLAKGMYSPSKADFGLASPNPMVPLELKALLREVAPPDEEEDEAGAMTTGGEESDASPRKSPRELEEERRRRKAAMASSAAAQRRRRGSGSGTGSGTDSGDDRSPRKGSPRNGNGKRNVAAELEDARASPSSRKGKGAIPGQSAASDSSSSSSSTLSIELVHSNQVGHVHRFFTWQTSLASEAAVRRMIDSYLASATSQAKHRLLLQQLMVTPGNTVSREDQMTMDESSNAQPVQQQQQSALSSTHLSHTFTYAPHGPPRFTLMLVLRDDPEGDAEAVRIQQQAGTNSEAAQLWPGWAASFHALLRSTCPDIAAGMQSRRTEEERARADPAQPCFRELRPVRATTSFA